MCVSSPALPLPLLPDSASLLSPPPSSSRFLAPLHPRPLLRLTLYSYPRWSGGLYCTPTLSGGQPGAVSAASWASLVRLGSSGLAKAAGKILDAASYIRTEATKIRGIAVMGEPKAMIVAFRSDPDELELKVTNRGYSFSVDEKDCSLLLWTSNAVYVRTNRGDLIQCCKGFSSS